MTGKILRLLLVTACCGSMSLARPASRQKPDEQQSKPSEQQSQETKPPRVVGKAQSEAEMTAYRAIEAAPDPEQQVQLGQQFLDQFPESGLTPLVHRRLAFIYLQKNDYTDFKSHAEKALEELPGSPDLLIRLAYGDAEQGNVESALQRGTQGLQVLGNMAKPPQAPAVQWAREKAELSAEGNYAVGLCYMKKYMTSGSKKATLEDPNISQAIDHLKRSVEIDPAFDASYYRLGFLYVRLNDAQNALLNYARAVAVNGVAAPPARTSLEQVYKFVHKNTDGIEDLIAQQKNYIQSQKAQKQKELDELQKLEDQEKAEREKMTTQPTTPPPPR